MAVAAVIAVIASVAQYEQQKKAYRAEQRRAQAELNMKSAQYAREKRQAMREERIKRAQMQSVLIAQGAAGSSAEAQGVSSLRGQLFSNIAFGNQMQQFQSYIYNEQSQVIAHQARAQFYGDVKNTALSFMGGMK